MSDRTYPHPRPRLLTVRLLLMAVPFLAGILTAGLRTAAGEHLIAYWGWVESVAAAVVIEGGELAFLLRWINARNEERDDWVAAVGMVLGMTVSVAFSTLLALSNGEHIAPSVRTFGQAVVVVASIGINVLTFLASRGLAATIVEHEAADVRWQADEREWQNKELDKAERRRIRAERKSVQTERGAELNGQGADGASPVRTRAGRERTMLLCYRTRADWTTAELMAALNCKRTAVYEIRAGLVGAGRLAATDGGYAIVDRVVEGSG